MLSSVLKVRLLVGNLCGRFTQFGDLCLSKKKTKNYTAAYEAGRSQYSGQQLLRAVKFSLTRALKLLRGLHESRGAILSAERPFSRLLQSSPLHILVIFSFRLLFHFFSFFLFFCLCAFYLCESFWLSVLFPCFLVLFFSVVPFCNSLLFFSFLRGKTRCLSRVILSSNNFFFYV